jgi:hypothetical protein
LANIRTVKNQVRPVNRLTPELFAKVFEFRRTDKDLIMATHVCARWRSILLSTPFFWTEIDFSNTICASVFIERSRAALIDVSVAKSRSFLNPEAVFLGAIPWVSRMKSLYIYAEEEQIRTIAKRLCIPTPNLQSLTIKRQPSRSQSPGRRGCAIYIPHEFLGRHAPSLQSLTFSSISPLVVPSFPLPKLTNIDWVAETAHVAIEELLELLASSPLLEVIRMHVRARMTQSYLPLMGVTLNNLRKLDWGDCEGPISLAAFLIAPELNDLTLRVTSNPKNPRITLSTILPSQTSQFPLLVEPKSLKYTYQHAARSCRFAYENAIFFVREVPGSRTANPTIDRWFSSNTPISFGQTLEMTVEASGGCPPLDDIPIELFYGLQTLMLAGETNTLVPMIRPSHGISRSTTSVPCPALSEVWIAPRGVSFPLRVLAEVLRERREAGYGVHTVRIWGKHECVEEEIGELGNFVENLVIE